MRLVIDMIEFSKSCLVNKPISKKIFYDKMNISSSIKKDMNSLVEKIIWLYKLSPDTIGIEKTNKIEELQVFQINVRERKVPITIINMITKVIPYKILFIIKYKKDFCYAINAEKVYFSDWNEEIKFNFNSVNLGLLYENMIKSIIHEEENFHNLRDILENKSTLEDLEKRIRILTNKLKIKKQFNRKVELNIELNKLKQEMEELLNE